jgi:hypothetical protein
MGILFTYNVDSKRLQHQMCRSDEIVSPDTVTERCHKMAILYTGVYSYIGVYSQYIRYIDCIDCN